jgi:dipeptidyl aminopeptidase/acylaminoacyl peptidase
MVKQRYGWFGIIVLLGGLAMWVLSCGTGQPELIPREVLFGNPEKASPKISPDGSRLAYIAPDEGVLNVWIRTIGEKDDRVVTRDRDRGIRSYFWSQDNSQILYIQDKGGNENWQLFAVDLETDSTRLLTPQENVQVQIIDTNKEKPGTLAIAMNKENPRFHDAYRIDLETGELSLAARNPGNVTQWIADANLHIKAALGATPDGGTVLLVRPSEDATWEQLLTWSPENSMSSGPITFNKTGDALYLIDSREANAGRLVELNLDTQELTVLAEDPQYDVSRVMIHPDTYKVQAVAFNRAKLEWTVLDESIQQDFNTARNLDEGEFILINRDHADDHWLVGFIDDDGPVSYYDYNRRTQKGSFLFDHRPVLNDYELAEMQPISFMSRDSLTIHGYITFPPGLGKTNLPMVLNVHGGPWARDTWGYDPEAQWLANRGYVCLQVNFRGSTGYGKEFLNAGNMEWGRKMQNDLTDAVHWAIDQGYADSSRVAIYGGSYGGYAALAGAAFTPDLYTCAVDIVGPSNIITLIQSVPPYWTAFLSQFYTRVGHPEKDAELLKRRSPLFSADSIRIPMLIAQGANDPRVKQAESEQIVEALKEKGVDYRYLLFPDEGHGFAKPENRLTFYAEAETFLSEHLGGRYEPAQEIESDASIITPDTTITQETPPDSGQ